MKTSGITPSREQLNTLLEYFENGRFDKAEKLALSLSKQFPVDNISLKILGSVLNKTGRGAEAVSVWIKVTDINHFSAFDIVKYKKIVFTESSIKELEKRYS